MSRWVFKLICFDQVQRDGGFRSSYGFASAFFRNAALARLDALAAENERLTAELDAARADLVKAEGAIDDALDWAQANARDINTLYLLQVLGDWRAR